MRNSSFRLSIQASRTLNHVVAGAHLIIACVSAVSSLAPNLKVALLLGIGASLAYQRRPQARRYFEFRPDGSVIYLGLDDSSSVGAGNTPPPVSTINKSPVLRVDASSRLLGPLMAIHLLPISITPALMVLPDALNSAEDYRRLRIWLKIHRKGKSSHHDVESVLRVQDRI